ncbi:hypothetical protein [Cryptosporangium sp. NPDC051539]|uniref:hypothetical protein n=1 Tax=Cryptosporangium sp. NPDC051539 TaxID=3363962 RepID=UPI00378AE215
MGRQYDVNINSAVAVDHGTPFAIDEIPAKEAFDILAEFEIGSSIRQFDATYTVLLTVVNNTRVEQTLKVTDTGSIAGTSGADPVPVPVTVAVAANTWAADPGDDLELRAVLLYKAGAVTYSAKVLGNSFLVA